MRISNIIMGIILTGIGCAAAWGACWLYYGLVVAPKIAGPSTIIHARVYVGKLELRDIHLTIAVSVVAVICLSAGAWRLCCRK